MTQPRNHGNQSHYLRMLSQRICEKLTGHCVVVDGGSGPLNVYSWPGVQGWRLPVNPCMASYAAVGSDMDYRMAQFPMILSDV